MKDKWSAFYNDHGRFYLTPHEDIKKFINLARKFDMKKVLDLGCGTGRHVVKLAQEGFDVSGIDMSPSAAQLAEKWLHEKGLEGDIIVGNFDDEIKDFEDESFDAVLAVNTLEYGQESELEENLNGIQKMLKSKGLLFIVYRSKDSNLKHAEAPVQFLEQDQLETKIAQLFDVMSSTQDKNKNYVVFARKKV